MPNENVTTRIYQQNLTSTAGIPHGSQVPREQQMAAFALKTDVEPNQ